MALKAWSSGGADAGTAAPPPRYLVGELASAEAGPAELRLRLRMSAAQARASAPESLPAPAPGFQAARCSLFFDDRPSLRPHLPKCGHNHPKRGCWGGYDEAYAEVEA